MPADAVEREALGLAGVHEVRTTGDVHHGLCQGFVERHERIAVATDAGAVAEGCFSA